MNTENDSDPKRHYKQLANAIVDLVHATTNPSKQKPEGSPTYDAGIITWGDKKLELKKDSGEDFVCAYMFNQSVNNRVSWDEIYEAMEGMKGQVVDARKSDVIYDAHEGVNQKCLKTFGIKIFKWKNKALERIY